MILRLGGITTEITNPAEITLYKRRGWIEVGAPVVDEITEVIADDTDQTPEEKNAAAIDAINKPKRKAKAIPQGDKKE